MSNDFAEDLLNACREEGTLCFVMVIKDGSGSLMHNMGNLNRVSESGLIAGDYATQAFECLVKGAMETKK